ncbi:MAG: DUF2953 domain-containing protein [Tissierellia bacterium]|nr:DUF2953 domain-containing protein [Tissierellia bacterium]
MVYLVIFLFIVFILIILPIKIKFHYEFTDSSKYKVTITYLFGLIKREIDSTRKEKKENKNKKDLSNFKKIDAYELLRYFIDKGKIKKLYLKTYIGLNDPFLLGIIVGVIWSIISIVFGFILRDKTIDEIKDKDVLVHPCFNQDIFQMFFLCIIKVSLVYIIVVYIRFLKKRKGGDIFARTSHRRLNENYNG